MPEVDTQLASSLRQAKSRRMYFAFVAKGSSDGQLLVSGKAIPAKDIKEAKVKCGGTTVIQGRCIGEDGKTVFETPQPPPATLAGQLRKVIVRDAGLSLQVETRVNVDAAPPAEADDEAVAVQQTPAPPPAPPPPPPAADAAAFKERMKAVLPRLQQAGQKAPERKAVLDKLAAQAVAAAKANDVPQALALADRLDAAAGLILGATSPPPPPAPPPPSPMADIAGEAAFRARMKAVVPQYQQAARQAPDRKAELDKIAGQAASAAKAGDFGRGLEFADQLAKAAAQVTAAPPHGPTPDAPTTPAVDAAAFKERMKAVLPQYQQAARQAPDRKAELDKIAGQAASAAKAGDFARGLEFADQLAKAAAQVTAAPPPDAPPGPTPDAPTTPAGDAAQFKTRLKEVLPLYKEAVEKAPDRKEELARLATQASAAGQAKKFAEAIDLVEQLEARSRSALRAAGAKAEIGADKGANVAFKKARLAYLAARARAESGLARVKAAILADPITRALPEYPQIKAQVARLDALLAPLDDSLVKALDKCMTAAPDDRPKARDEVLAIVDKYEKSVNAEPMFQKLDAGTGYGAFAIHKPLIAAMNSIRKQLA